MKGFSRAREGVRSDEVQLDFLEQVVKKHADVEVLSSLRTMSAQPGGKDVEDASARARRPGYRQNNDENGLLVA